MSETDNPLVLERLRKDVEAMPPGALLPRNWLLDRLSETSTSASSEHPALPVDLSVGDLAKLFSKRPSTVRAWLERGDFPGAYKLQGKEWRVPPSGVEAFQNHQRSKTQVEESGTGAARLSAWRSVRRENTPLQSETGRDTATSRSSRGNAEDGTSA